MKFDSGRTTEFFAAYFFQQNKTASPENLTRPQVEDSWKLEPDRASNFDDPVTQRIANHVISDSGIAEPGKRGMHSGIFNHRINALKVRMVENIDCGGAEFRGHTLGQFEPLE